jgi:type IV fimbrial biogenesis protein FimT
MTNAARRRSPRLRALGFSMVESLVATAIAGVLAAASLPRFAEALDRQRLTATTNELVLAVNLARAEATARKTRVAIAPRARDDWTSGWRVFVDENGNGRFDTGEHIVRDFADAPERMTIDPRFGSFDGHVLSFDHAGHLRRPNSNGMLLGRFVLRLGSEVRALCFSAAALRTLRTAVCT